MHPMLRHAFAASTGSIASTSAFCTMPASSNKNELNFVRVAPRTRQKPKLNLYLRFTSHRQKPKLHLLSRVASHHRQKPKRNSVRGLFRGLRYAKPWPNRGQSAGYDKNLPYIALYLPTTYAKNYRYCGITANKIGPYMINKKN